MMKKEEIRKERERRKHTKKEVHIGSNIGENPHPGLTSVDVEALFRYLRCNTQLLQQANKHQLLSQNQLNMVGSEIGCMHCIHCINVYTHALVYTHMWKFSVYDASPISPHPFRGVAKNC